MVEEGRRENFGGETTQHQTEFLRSAAISRADPATADLRIITLVNATDPWPGAKIEPVRPAAPELMVQDPKPTIGKDPLRWWRRMTRVGSLTAGISAATLAGVGLLTHVIGLKDAQVKNPHPDASSSQTFGEETVQSANVPAPTESNGSTSAPTQSPDAPPSTSSPVAPEPTTSPSSTVSETGGPPTPTPSETPQPNSGDQPPITPGTSTTG